MRRSTVRFAATLCALAVTAIVSCGKDAPNLLVRPFDAGSDGGDAAADGGDLPGDAAANADADPTLGGPCVDDAQCDDQAACTFDRCDLELHRCRNVPDDTACDDGVYCNGREVCGGRRGCVPGPVVTCEDGTACTIDRCVESTRSCDHANRDIDGDGDPDDRCVASHDCNDLEPAVSSKHSEVCANAVDDDCDGTADETPCAAAENDTCAAPLAITQSGTYSLTTLGAKKDYGLSCIGTTYTHDVVATVTIPAGAPKDLDLWATSTGTPVAVAVQATCGDGGTELACGGAQQTYTARTRARGLAPGTYAVIVSTQLESSVDLSVDLRDATTPPANESCATPAPIAGGTTTKVELIDAAKDLPSACAGSGAPTGELTYALTLATAADVRVFASTVRGSGAPIVGLRAPSCSGATDELRCRVGSTLPLFARALPPGTYVVTVAATAPVDVNVIVQTSAPTTAPADQTCAAPPAAIVNRTMPVDLANHEDAIRDGCMAGGPTAAFALPLSVPSDVMLVARFPSNDQAAVSFDDATCTAAGRLACSSPTYSPIRTNKRNVQPGDWRIVLTDSLAQQGSLTTLVRPTVAPTAVLGAGVADACASALDVPADGAFFQGETRTALADFAASCDQGGVAGNGAPDRVFKLVVAQKKRVVLSMEGSTYSTILDVRGGPTCPGQAVAGGCFVGFYGARSFLDMLLDPGTYWIIVDGYSGASGDFYLDVRVVDP